MEGKLRESWDDISIRVTDAAVIPGVGRLVAVGIEYSPPQNSRSLARGLVRESSPPPSPSLPPPSPPSSPPTPPTPPFVASYDSSMAGYSSENRMIIYDLETRQVKLYGQACLFYSVFAHRSLRTGLST
jgi:hypothetical protein